MKINYLWVALFLLSCKNQENLNYEEPINHVSASGNGIIMVNPDIVEITIIVEFTKNTMREAMNETHNVMSEVLKISNKYVKDSNDIQTTRVSTNKEFDWNFNKKIFKGFNANQTLVVKIKKFGKHGKIYG